MFSTDNLFSLFFFTVPGCIFIIYNKYLRYDLQNKDDDDSAKFAAAIIFSFIMFGFNYFAAYVSPIKHLEGIAWFLAAIFINIIIYFFKANQTKLNL